jgi:hypothetical protein
VPVGLGDPYSPLDPYPEGGAVPTAPAVNDASAIPLAMLVAVTQLEDAGVTTSGGARGAVPVG